MYDISSVAMVMQVAAAVTGGTPASTPDNTVKVAVVAACGVVLAAAVTAFATTFQRRTSPAPAVAPVDDHLTIQGLLDRATLAEARAAKAEELNERYERLLVEHHVNPYTGEDFQ